MRSLRQRRSSTAIMYGSDQAVWPAIIPYSIAGIESGDFLSPEQKRAILCGNAARFPRLDPKLCEGGVQ